MRFDFEMDYGETENFLSGIAIGIRRKIWFNLNFNYNLQIICQQSIQNFILILICVIWNPSQYGSAFIWW